MKINIGDYVRTKDGLIAKYTGYEKDNENEYSKYLFDGKIYWYFEYYNDYVYEEDFKEWFENYVIKSSPNIIDLVQEGDYVNGYRVDDIKYFYDDKKIILDEKYQRYAELVLKGEKDIKSIVTKEQFESMEYKIGEV